MQEYIYSVCNTDTTWEPKRVLWLPAEVMKKIESLKLITALSVGLSFLAITILSHWSLKINLRRDGNYTGKKTSHLLAFKNSERILISISVKFSDIIAIGYRLMHFVLHFHRPRSGITPLLLSFSHSLMNLTLKQSCTQWTVLGTFAAVYARTRFFNIFKLLKSRNRKCASFSLLRNFYYSFAPKLSSKTSEKL